MHQKDPAPETEPKLPMSQEDILAEQRARQDQPHGCCWAPLNEAAGLFRYFPGVGKK